MADAAARREARRRKILENSTNRLKLITGEHNGSIKDFEHDSFKVQNFDNENKENERDVMFLLNTDKQIIENHVHETNYQELIPENDSRTSIKPEQKIINNSSKIYDYLKHSKMYVISLAIIIRLLFIFQMQFCVRDSIILPFIIFEMTLLFFKSDVQNSNAFLHTFLLLSLPSSKVLLISRILKLVENFVIDFCLYFFTFLILHVCLESFI